jgi:hypothetical protein
VSTLTTTPARDVTPGARLTAGRTVTAVTVEASRVRIDWQDREGKPAYAYWPLGPRYPDDLNHLVAVWVDS